MDHGIRIETYSDLAAVADIWKALQRTAVAVPHQTFEWVEAWHETIEAPCGGTPAVVVGRGPGGRALFLLPFLLARWGPLRVLVLLGGNQGNYGSGLYDPAFLASCEKEAFLALWSDIRRHLPRHDIVHFRSLVHDRGTGCDPLRWLPSVCSAEYGHAFALEPDADAVYRSRFSAKVRADHRRCERRLADKGPVELECATDPERLMELFDRLCAQRAVQARETGVPNPLADPAARQFYKRFLRAERADGAPVPYIFALHCGEDIAATNFGLCFHGRFYGLMMSTTPGPLRRFGPGTILFRRMVQQLSARGCKTIDCGAGRDSHKLQWCDQARERCDALAATSWPGMPVAAAIRLAYAVKRVIKNDARLWRIVKAITRRVRVLDRR